MAIWKSEISRAALTEEVRVLRSISQQTLVGAAGADQLHSGPVQLRNGDYRSSCQTHRQGVAQDRTPRLAMVGTCAEVPHRRARGDQKIVLAQQGIHPLPKRRMSRARISNLRG